MQPIIFHIDVNSAFLSWSAVEKLKTDNSFDLRTIPSIVGGDQTSRHGVVLAKSIPAKTFGIKTGEPISRALQKCPNLYIEPAVHKMYQAYSKNMFEFLYTFTSDIEQLSIDECFMDFTPIAKKYDSYLSCAVKIKDGIKQKFGFTVNIGISNNRLLAKMASDFLKPDKIHTLFPNEIEKKMWPLPVDDLYMVGKASATRLHGVGIHTIGDLAKTDKHFLSLEFKSHGILMWEYANGIDSSTISSKSAPAKGIGNSTTLSKDLTKKEEAYPILLSLCESVSRRLRHSKQLAQSLSVEIKYYDFTSCSHQMPLFSPTDSTDKIYASTRKLFLELWNQKPVRLLGVRATKLVSSDAPVQMTLFDYETTSSQEKITEKSRQQLTQLDHALDSIRQKYGSNAIVRGSLLKKDSPDNNKKDSK